MQTEHTALKYGTTHAYTTCTVSAHTERKPAEYTAERVCRVMHNVQQPPKVGTHQTPVQPVFLHADRVHQKQP